MKGNYQFEKIMKGSGGRENSQRSLEWNLHFFLRGREGGNRE